VRTAECIDGMVEIDLVCEPAFDYGRVPGEWALSEDEHRAEAIGAGQTLVLRTDMLLGIEAGRARARHVLRAGETVHCALGWSDQARVPTTSDEALAPSTGKPTSSCSSWPTCNATTTAGYRSCTASTGAGT